jgi:hypothetical protein
MEITDFFSEIEDRLTVQDALIVLAVYAAEIDPDDCTKEVGQIHELARDHPFFEESSEDLRARINKFANVAGSGNFHQLLDLAVASLADEHKKTAYEWSAALSKACGKTSDATPSPRLEQIASLLSTD